MIIGFISQKGGVGKSTISRALAREAANAGLIVKIADLDVQQGTSVNWARRRLANEIIPIFSVEHFKTARQAIAAAEGVELLIIDAPARSSEGTLEVAKHADLIVQPSGASVDDLEPAILVFHELVKNGISKNKLVFALSRIGTESEVQAARQYIAQAGYDVLEGALYEKASYRQAQNQGYSITETKYGSLNAKADNLIQNLIDKI